MGMALGPSPNGVYVIGATEDETYGGDMSNDTANTGAVALDSADSSGTHFALAVYGDDGGSALTAGWASSIFGSFVIHTAVTGGINLSAFGVTGQIHVKASVAGVGNLAGVYGVAESSGDGVTITNNFFGGLFGATLASGDTLASGYYAGALLLGGNYSGTTTGTVVGIYFQNPTSSANFDAAFAFGQNSEFAGVVTAAAVGGSNTHKLKVYAGGTLFYIPMYTA